VRHPQICLALRCIAVFLAFASICPAQLTDGGPPPPPVAKSSPDSDIVSAPQRDPKDEEPVIQELKKVSPKSVETFQSATRNLDSGNFDEAIEQYNEVLKQAPDFEPALRRLGYALIGAGKHDDGVAAARKALVLHRSADNLIGSANTLLGLEDMKYEPTKVQQQEALNLLNETAKLQNDNDPQTLYLIAQVSLNLDRLDDFYNASGRLSSRYPDFPPTHYFNSIVLADKGDFDAAPKEITTAESMGLNHAEAERLRGAFQQAQDESMFGLYAYRNYFKALVGVILLWAIGLVGLFVTGKVLSSKTLHAIENADPNDVTGGGQAALRRFYRKIITIAGVYYYVSQPIVAVVVIAATVGIVVFFLAVGYIPIKLMLIIIFVGGASIFYMAKSLFTRAKVEDPGRVLSETEASELWSLVRQVAESVNTRPVDEIRITEGVDLAVYERGGWRVKMQDKAERILTSASQI